MPFWGGATSSEKNRFTDASNLGQQRMDDLYGRYTGGADQYGGRSWDRLTGADEQSNFLWGQLWGEGGRFNPASGFGGGMPGGPKFDTKLWKQLRDTGDLTGGDWGKARETYEDFRTTGGFSPDDLSNLRSRALSGTEIYDPSADARSRVQGGWGAPTAGSDLARQKAIADLRNKAAWGAEADISEQTRAGKQWGASSLEGLGGRVQEGRITGQGRMDDIAKQRAAAARARWGAGQAALNAQWGRSMDLLGMNYGNVGQTGANLPYLQGAGGAAQGGYGMASDTFNRQQQNKGWGQQLLGAAGQGIGAVAGLGWQPFGRTA